MMAAVSENIRQNSFLSKGGSVNSIKPPVKHFTDLIVWQKAHNLFVDIYNALDLLPQKVGAKTITDQIFRSTGSISANIAEGFNSNSTKKYINYLEIAQKSAAETENWIYKIRDCKLLDKSLVAPWLNTCCQIQKMLQSLKKNLAKKMC